MDTQTLINIAFGTIGAMGGWMLNRIWLNMDRVEGQVSATEQRMHKIEVLVAGQYVRREEFTQEMQRLFSKLDSIEEKVSAKADK